MNSQTMKGITFTATELARIQEQLQDLYDSLEQIRHNAEIRDYDSIESMLFCQTVNVAEIGKLLEIDCEHPIDDEREPDIDDDFPIELEYNDNDPRFDQVLREEAAMEREAFGDM